MRDIIKYQTAAGKEPFNEWLKSLDWVSQARIDAYVVRASLGSAKKNIRHVGDGVYEIKIDYGPGYRVYFAVPESQILLLILGGSKRSQDRDIRTAKQYWRNYLEKNTKL